MIEKTLKTGMGTLRVRIPTIMAEITLGQMIAIQERPSGDDLDIISILAGVPRDELPESIDLADFQAFGNYLRSLSHQVRYLYQGDIITQKITFTLDDARIVTVNVARNLSIEPAGAFIAASNIIAGEINEHIHLYGELDWKRYFQPSLKACCELLAQYFFCRATGQPYNEAGVNQFVEEVKKLMVTEALPIARHFFAAYPELLNQRTSMVQRFYQFTRRRQIARRLQK